MACGIYMIRNRINEKIYIGQSVNIKERWCRHSCPSSIKEPKFALTKAFAKYGVENFDFLILEEIEEEFLNEKEIYYISKYNSYLKGYNETRGGNQVSNSFTLFDEETVLEIRFKRLEGLSPTDAYKEYSHLMKYPTFAKIWSGASYSQKHLLPPGYEDKDTLKRLESNLKRSKNAKVSIEDVKKIRLRKEAGEKRGVVMKDYPQLSKDGFDGIWYYKKWKDV